MLLVILGLFLGSIMPGLLVSFGGWLKTGVFSWHCSVRVIGGMVVAIPAAYFILRHYGIPIGRAFDLGSLPIPSAWLSGVSVAWRWLLRRSPERFSDGDGPSGCQQGLGRALPHSIVEFRGQPRHFFYTVRLGEIRQK